MSPNFSIGSDHKKRLGFYDSFQDFMDRLIWTYLNWRPQMNAVEITDDRNAALVIFVDDLDRCPRDRIPQVLETVKLFMDSEGCVFVIGAAGDIIENALTLKYGAEDAGKFMDKIVQVTFNLPQLLEEDFKSYLDLIGPDQKEDLADHLPLIVSAMKSNPRRIKRFLNNLSLLQGILLSREVEIDFRGLFFWSIIDYLAPSLRDDLKDNPRILAELKKHIQAVEQDLGDTVSWDIPESLKENIPASFQPYIKDRELVRIVQEFDAEPGQLTQLAALSGIVQSPEEVKAKEQDEAKVAITGETEKEVPVGKFKFGKTTRVTRYPNGISPVGCYDMAGNVWEWTSSWFDDEKTDRVLRGGSWNDDQNNARCANRNRNHPNKRNNNIGFRCASTFIFL